MRRCISRSCSLRSRAARATASLTVPLDSRVRCGLSARHLVRIARFASGAVGLVAGVVGCFGGVVPGVHEWIPPFLEREVRADDFAGLNRYDARRPALVPWPGFVRSFREWHWVPLRFGHWVCSGPEDSSSRVRRVRGVVAQ